MTGNATEVPVNSGHSPAWLPALLLFGVSLTAFYPGFMSLDSLSQYTEARNFRFSDWHPPMMAALWAAIDFVVAGPVGMLFVQLLAYWGSLGMAADAAWQHGDRRWWLWLAIGLLPATINFAGVIWKDVGMAVSFLLASVLLLRACVGMHRPTMLVLPLLLYGAGVRWNALPAALPLIWWWIALRFPNSGRLHRAGGAMLALVVGVILIFQINYRVLHASPTAPWQFGMLHDLVAIGCASDSPPALPEFRNPDTTNAQLCAAYVPGSAENLFWVGVRPPLHFDQAAARALARSWLDAIIANPATYVAHRAAYYGNFLRIGQEAAFFTLCDFIEPNPYGIALKPSELRTIHYEYVKLFGNSFLLKPWFWLALSVGAFLVALRRRVTSAAVVSLSGALYLASYSVLGSVADFRFAYWTIFAASFAAVALIGGKRLMPTVGVPPGNPRVGRFPGGR